MIEAWRYSGAVRVMDLDGHAWRPGVEFSEAKLLCTAMGVSQELLFGGDGR